MQPRIERLYREIEEHRKRTEEEVSSAIRAGFYRARVFSAQVKGLVAYLLTFEDHNEALPTVRQAAADFGLTERSMSAYFSDLKNHGVLKLQRHQGAAGSIYDPLDLAAALSDDQIRAILSPVADLDQRRTPQITSGLSKPNQEAVFRVSETGFRNANPEGVFRDSQDPSQGVSSSSLRRRSLDKTATNDSLRVGFDSVNPEAAFPDRGGHNQENGFANGAKVNQEADFGVLRLAREDESEIRPIFDYLCGLCGAVPFAKLHPSWTAERLTEVVEHYPYFEAGGVGDPPTYMRLALEKGWSLSVKIRAAKRRVDREEQERNRRQVEQGREDLASQRQSQEDELLLGAYERATHEEQAKIQECAERYTQRIFGRRFDPTHRLMQAQFKRAISEVLNLA